MKTKMAVAVLTDDLLLFGRLGLCRRLLLVLWRLLRGLRLRRLIGISHGVIGERLVVRW